MQRAVSSRARLQPPHTHGHGRIVGATCQLAKFGFNGNAFGDYWIKPNYAVGIDVDGSFFKAKDDYITALKATTFPAYQDPKFTFNIIGFGVHTGSWTV